MKRLLTVIRVAAFFFYAGLYLIKDFDLISCVLGFLIVIAITTNPKQKKSEATTSDS